MDRRPRDIPLEDRFGGGQSYRPGLARDRSPPRRDRDNDSYGGRSPPRRPFDSRPPRGRSRSPPGRDGFRRRSPSRDGFRPLRGADTYRVRPRSPIRRDEGRDDLFRRDTRDFRDERPRDFNNRSPPRFRDRSPFEGRRSPRRDHSPPRRFEYAGSRPHSPPRRPLSPRPDRNFPSRPRSPPSRGEFADRDRQRPRSPSPRGFRRDLDDRRGTSGTTSRRSSPPMHASRVNLVQDEGSRSGRPSPRARSPEPYRRHDSPKKDRDGDIVLADAPTAAIPVKPRDELLDREPPSGPSADRAPPTGPARNPPTRTFAPPHAGPRGDSTVSRGGFAGRGRGYGDYPTQGRSSISATFRDRNAPLPAVNRSSSFERETIAPVVPAPRTFSDAAPRQPPIRTASTSSQLRYGSNYDSARPAPIAPQADTYRRPSSKSGPPSGPANERMRDPRDDIHPALRDLPEIIPNGKRLAPIVDQTRLHRLEEESERLRRLVVEKDAKKRRNLREWDRMVREGESAAYRSELAEAGVRAFDGDGERAGAAF